MSNERTTTTGTIGCGGLLAVLLTVLFVGLKLTNVIDWEWIWVISPVWIYAGLVVSATIVIFTILAIVSVVALVIAAIMD